MLEAIAANPWPWISFVLAGANGYQFLAASKDRQQARQDMMQMLPAVTNSAAGLQAAAAGLERAAAALERSKE